MNQRLQLFPEMNDNPLTDIDVESTCRHSQSMESNLKLSKTQTAARQIVGFSLPPELAVEVKIEAARRNLTLRQLFIELWTLYKSNKPE